IADRVAPLVPGNEVPAGPAIDAGMQLLQRCDNFRAKTLHVVSWHQRNCSNVEGTIAGTDNLETSIIAVSLRLKMQRELHILVAEFADGNALAVARSVSPDQSHPHSRVRCAGQDEVARVGFPSPHC